MKDVTDRINKKRRRNIFPSELFIEIEFFGD